MDDNTSYLILIMTIKVPSGFQDQTLPFVHGRRGV